MITAVESCFWKSCNLFMANFSHSYSIVKNKLFTQFCCSFYGTPLWGCHDFEQISVAWKKVLRVLWNVPRKTHFSIIVLFSESAPLSIQLKACFFLFMCKALVHDNSTLTYVTKLASLPESYVCECKELA